jgi:hypothetical protein
MKNSNQDRTPNKYVKLNMFKINTINLNSRFNNRIVNIYDELLGNQTKIYRNLAKHISSNYDKLNAKSYLDFIFPYSYLNPQSDYLDNKYNKEDIINNQIIPYILNHKFISPYSLFLWEINHRFNLLNKHTKNICIFSSEYINDTIYLLNDKIKMTCYYPKLLIDKSYPDINNIYDIQYSNKDNNNTANYKHIQDIKQFIDICNNFEKHKYDFVYIDIVNKHWLFRNISPYKDRQISRNNTIGIYLYYIISSIIGSLNTKSNAIIVLPMICSYLHMKIITLFGYLFEEVEIYSPECNQNMGLCFYAIFKNKKNIDLIDDYSNYIHNLTMIKNTIILLDLNKINEIHNIDFIKLKLLYPELKNNKKNITQQFIKIAKIWLIETSYLLKNAINFISKDIFNNPEYSKFIKNKKEKNLYDCILYTKKYDLNINLL